MALGQGVDTIMLGFATMVDVISTGFEILLQNMRDAGKAAVAVANGEFKKAQEIATETLQDTKEDAGDLMSRLEERGTAGRRRMQRRQQGLPGAPPDTGSSAEDEPGGSAGKTGGGGGAAAALGGEASDAASGVSELGSATRQTAEQMTTSERRIREAERKAKEYRKLGFEDRASEQQAKADRLKKLRRQMKRAVVKDPDLSLFDGDGGSGGGGGSSGGATTGAPANAGATAATGGGPRGAPAWTTTLNATLSSLQSSITELTATSVVANAIADAVDGATLSLSGTLAIEDNVATLDDVDARIKQTAQRDGRRARDLGTGNIR
jgi:hypothetical protein